MVAMMARPLTEHMRSDGLPVPLSEYLSNSGYEGLKRAQRDHDAQSIIGLMVDSGLLGRGGAGFSTGKKIQALKKKRTDEKRYLVVNADEMEPGTFKDRFLLERHPHQLIEGILIECCAIDADVVYIFLRGEYVRAELALRQALREATLHGLIAEHLKIHVHMSAGRYICGEETALLNALEGKRAIPRAKPPYPQASGLFGMPTVVQNVETIANLPHIINHGAAWFRSLGKAHDAGTKIYGVSGRVNQANAFELPMGTTAREIIFDHAHGMKDGFSFRAFMPGGASTEILGENFLDVPMDFSTMMEHHTRLGTGNIIVIDHRICPVALLANLEDFFRRESCGFCTPCREGLSWVYQLLLAIEMGLGTIDDIKILEEHTSRLSSGYTFCALAPGAMAPLSSGIKLFRDDLMEHISMKRCPYKK